MLRRSALYTVEKKKEEEKQQREKRENKNEVKRERERDTHTHIRTHATHTRWQEEALKDPKEKNERLNFHENPACPDHMVGVSINRKRQAKN